MNQFSAFVRFCLAIITLSLITFELSAEPQKPSPSLDNPLLKVNIADFDDINVPRLELTATKEEFDRILAKREFALEQRMLERGPNDYVLGHMKYNDEEYRVKFRLKGDYIEHLQQDKWSFRIKVKGGKTIMGMKTFSLQHPRMRLFLHEWTIMKALAYENLIALRYSFVKLTINGVYLGLYNMEEHFDKRLVENNQRRESAVFKFDEAALFDLIKKDIYSGGKHDNDLFFESAILPFQKKKSTRDPRQKELFERGSELLDAFRKGEARVSEVFNVEQLAKYYAISDVFMGKHGNRWHNQRFYFNPIDERIEPIGFDFNDDKPGLDPLSRINRQSGLFNGTNWAFDVFSRMIFSDPVFFEAYKRNADRIAAKSYMDDLFTSIAPEAKKLERILAHEFDTPKYKKYIHFDHNFKKSYYDNQTYVRNALNKKMALKVHLKQADDNSMSVVYNNRDQHLLEIFEYRVGDKRYPIKELPPLHTYRFYNPYIPSTGNLMAITIPTENNLTHEEVFFRYRTLGGKESWETPLITTGKAPGAHKLKARKSILEKEKKHPMWAQANWETFPLFQKNGDSILGKKGSWVLDKTIIFPANTHIELPAGMEIDFRNGASIVSRSAISLYGTNKNPVVLHSSDKTGGGVFIAHANKKSLWRFAQISGLSAPSYKEWKPTGAVTFYKSPVTIKHSLFDSNNSEDSLNTINTDINLYHNTFSTTTSDAFDADFCTGTMQKNTFENIGNDAVDVSGSQIIIDGLKVNNAGDKGISVGERSHIKARNVSVHKAGIGLASKDASTLFVTSANLSDTSIGICAYQKKPEYGPPEIHVTNLNMSLAVLPTVFDEGSLITINNREVVNFFAKKKKVKPEAPQDATKEN